MMVASRAGAGPRAPSWRDTRQTTRLSYGKSGELEGCPLDRVVRAGALLAKRASEPERRAHEKLGARDGGRAGGRRDRRGDRRHRPARAHGDHLHPRPRQPIPQGLLLRSPRQRHRPSGRSGADRAGGRRRQSGAGLRHDGGHHRVPRPGAARARCRAQRHVLGPTQVAAGGRAHSRHRGDPCRCGGPRRHPCRRATGQDQARLDRDARQPALDHHRHRRGGRHRPPGRRAAGGQFHSADAGPHATHRPWRRRRHAFRHQVPQRPFRRDSRRARVCAGRRLSRARDPAARHAGRHPRALRGGAAVARHAHACTCACATSAPAPCASPSTLRDTPGSRLCSTQGWRRTRDMRPPGARCRAASAACCRCG